MPQFDILTLSSQIFGLYLSLTLYYYSNINKTFIHFNQTIKSRSKKLKKSNLAMQKLKDSLQEDQWFFNKKYKEALKIFFINHEKSL